ncbi:S8 family serine peptidase [Terrabacter terrigena]|uniref:S8 family serine peptidase n=1 Tax=Terrabacter terrigena TaxID=574718 RepID=A0ABW3MTD8_9MICO
MLSRRPFAAALTLALVAPVTALSTTSASAAPTSSVAAAAKPTAKHLPRPTRQGKEQQAHDPHTVLVKFKKNASKAVRDKAAKSRGGRQAEALEGTDFVKVTTTGNADELASRLSADPAVADVTLDYIRETNATPNDLGYASGDQDYLKTVRMPSAWDRSKGSLSQVVAVVDTGVNGKHPDLLGRTVSGFNFVSNVGIVTGSASDNNGHGSMVAGIVAAQTNNTEGIAGVAWNARVMPVKVLNSAGQGTDSNIIKGIRWAVDHGARIVNLSLGGPDDSPALHDAVKYAVGKGAVVVVAAGNSGSDEPEYPAAYPEAIAVGATDNAGRLVDFSTHGSWVDVAAPGWDILSTRLTEQGTGTYYFGSGTSFSAPIVSGIAALVRTQNPRLTPAQVAARLRSTARDAGPRGIDPFYGAGIVDATSALGGGWAGDFGQPASGADEPNDVPARATPLSVTAQGITGVEGDVDWFRYDSPSQRTTRVTLTPPADDTNLPQNMDPVLAVYDQNLRLVAQADQGAEGVAESVSLRMGGTYYVSVRNFNGSRVPDRPYTLTVQPGSAGVLNAGTPVASSGGYRPLELGDVDGDGRKDLVAGVGSGAGGQLHVRRGLASGLAAPVVYSTSGSSLVRSISLADVDGDNLLDVVVATDTGIQVFPQTAAHTLGAPQVVADTTGSTLVKAVDLDGDGRVDIVQGTATDVAALMAQPDGSWVRTVIDTEPATELEVGDLDDDGRPDVATDNGSALHVLRNTAAGWTRAVTNLLTDFPASGIEVADVNGDGRADLAAVTGGNSPSARLLVWHQNADGSLAPAVVSGMPDIPGPLEAADLTGDGRLDLVDAHDSWSTASVMEQRPDGTLMPASTSPMSSSLPLDPSGLVLGDVTGDGRTDAVVGTQTGYEVLANAGGPTVPGEQLWVRSAAPADFGGSAVTTAPSVTFVRDVVPASVTASTVGILDGKTGARVPAAVTYDPATRAATITPAAPLFDNAPYRLLVSGVMDSSGNTMTTPFTSTYRTTDAAPPAVGGFKATGAYRSATLTWTAPAIHDLDRYIVRMATGSTAPGSVSTGTSAYSGTGTSVTLGLTEGATYSFRIWPKDRTGHYGPSSAVTIAGTNESMTSNVTSLTSGGTVTVSSRLTRNVTGSAVAGVPVQLYVRRAGTTAWVLLTTRTSSSTGTVSFAHKPAASVDYWWVYRGSTTFVGSGSAVRRVGVRAAVTSNLSRTTLPLGSTFSLSGSVAPSHAGRTVYVQRYAGNNAWTTVTSRALSSSSTYAFTVRPTARGTFTYRVHLPADTDHLASYGPNRAVKVS